MKNLLFSVLLICAINTYAQNNYSIAAIPETLRLNALVVRRYEKVLLEATDIDRASISYHRVITVLQEAGKSELVFNEYTDKFQSIEDVEINLLDANGEITNRYKKKDLQTVALGEGLITDGYITYFRVPATRYPVTVEYKYTIRKKGILGYPSYHYSVPAVSVQQSSFTARISKSLQLRFKNLNSDLKAEISEDDKFKTYSWSVKNLPAPLYEEGSLNDYQKYPCIKLAPTQFKYDDYAGNLSSWASYGKWSYDLFKDQDNLPADRIDFLRGLVKNATSDREKAAILYKYMQDNFRYVSIQLGIGGFKPFSATFTDQKKYGDCKALTNYMRAALKAVGIKSYPATINSGENKSPMDIDFPAKSEDHVILCVPMEKDTVWLECTSKINDFGVLGTFTENRNALLLTENGGKLVATPRSKPNENLFTSTSIIKIGEDGSGFLTQQIFSSGEYRQLMQHLVTEKPDVHKEFAIFRLGLKQPDEFSMSPIQNMDGRNMNIKASFEKIPEFIAGSKMFMAPRLYKFWSIKLPKYDTRKLDYYFEHPFIKTDTTTFELPEGFEVDALPKSRTLECTYALYHSDYITEGNKIHSIVTMTLKDHRIPAAKYSEVKSFFDEVIREESQRIVIRKSS